MLQVAIKMIFLTCAFFSNSWCRLTLGWVPSGLWKTEWWDADMVTCLRWDTDSHMVQLMPLTISCSSKSRLVLPFWYRFTQAHTHTHKTILRLCGFCPGKPAWAGTR